MKNNILSLNRPSLKKNPNQGFTLVEVLVGSSLMLIVILAVLTLYVGSNKISVDQQQFAAIQHDVRSAMFFVSRDIKSIGAGIPQQFSGYFLQGVNNDPNQGAAPFQTDRLMILGNSDPLTLVIQSYVPGSGVITLEPDEFDYYPYTPNAYPADPAGYINRAVLILPNPDLNAANGELGQITGIDLVNEQIFFNQINEPLPNGLAPGGAAPDYSGGTVHFIELKTYWFDIDGNYPGLAAGQDGYLGLPGVMYVSQWNPVNNRYEHLALALNIEDLQFQYHGDLNGDQQLDDNPPADGVVNINDFLNWDETFVMTNNPGVVGGIRSVRILVLGKTENPYVTLTKAPPTGIGLSFVYGKPLIADSPAAAQADRHRRFLLESTANVRNMSLNVYNIGTI